MQLRSLPIGALVAAWVIPLTTLAHPLVDRGIVEYEDADFQAALDFFVEAEGRTDLNTDELLQLLEMRALVYHAIDDQERMRRDLTRLASIRPTFRLGPMAPPPVQSAFDEVREGISEGVRVDVSAEVSPGVLRVKTVVLNDVAQVGRFVEIHSHIEGDKWHHSVGERAVIRAPKDRRIHYYAVLVGPGGAAIAQTGTPENPREALITEGEIELRKAGLAPILLWGGAGAALISAAILGPIAKNKDGDLLKGCGSTVPPSCTQTQLDRVDRLARATDAMWITGAALAVSGTIVFLVQRRKNRKEREANEGAQSRLLRLAPFADRHRLGAAAELRF